MRNWNYVGLLSIAAIAVCILGCSGSKPQGSASGKVTFGGKPVTSGSVLFSDSTTGTGATAELDSSGGYQIDSIPTGSYQVAITLPPAPAPHEMQQAVISYINIPAMYQTPETSGLTATIKDGQNSLDFNL